MMFLIPTAYSSKFKEFFKQFEKDLDSLNILTYGISVSTLEEVFLKVGHLENPEEAFVDDISDCASI